MDEEKKERQKKTKEKAEAFAMAMKNLGLCPGLNVPLKGRQGSQGGVPDSPGSNPGPLHWEDGVLATGPPGKSLKCLTFE